MDQPSHLVWAPTPPMGWNSWDCFATTVTEAQVRAQAEVMARDLARFGWQYIVVDIQWYEPGAESHAYRTDAVLTMDEFGRLLPAQNRFPSAADGVGFKALADSVRQLGLRFGVHLMRGIPRQAVEKNLPVKGTGVMARDIANTKDTCPWNPDMYGVDMAKPGAQAYYDSVFELFASWGVDYVKVDDISRPYFDQRPEIEAIRQAIDKTGRPMVLSLSPGATPLAAAPHVSEHANLWRISDDFWDRWLAVRDQFVRLERWSKLGREGAWPDADMLPFGVLVMGERSTRLTEDEQRTVMTLWSIARSPLMMGGDLTKLDAFTLSLLQNEEVLTVNQASSGGRQLFDRQGLVAWSADIPGTSDKYLALFNARDCLSVEPKDADFAFAIAAQNEKEIAFDVDVKGGRRLFLCVNVEVDAPTVERITWSELFVFFDDGTKLALTDEPWLSADATWDTARTERDAAGVPIGVSSMVPARLEYALPPRAVRLAARILPGKWSDAADKPIVVSVTVDRSVDHREKSGELIEVDLDELGFHGPVEVRNLWTKKSEGTFERAFSARVPFHGAALFRVLASN